MFQKYMIIKWRRKFSGRDAYDRMNVEVDWPANARNRFPFAKCDRSGELCIMANVDSFVINPKTQDIEFRDANWTRYNHLLQMHIGKTVKLLICKIADGYKGCSEYYVLGTLDWAKGDEMRCSVSLPPRPIV
jgi:hypothetical protein